MTDARMHALIGSLLLTVIVVQLNYLGFRHYERWDWTEQKLFTLSEQSKGIVSSLDRDVTIYSFVSENEPNYADLAELLERYKAQSPRLRVQHVDIDRHPGELRRLRERFQIGLGEGADGEPMVSVAAVVAAGQRHWKINRSDLVEADFSQQEAPQVSVETEKAITGAIIQATSGRATKLCLTTGHGEWEPNGGDRSLFALREPLRDGNVDLTTLEGDPEDCDAVYVLGPQRAFRRAEAEALFEYVRGGGNLLLALDPVAERETILATGFEELAEEVGIQIDGSMVVELDEEYLLTPDPTELFLVHDWGDHTVVAPFASLSAPLLIANARTIRTIEGGGADELVRTSATAYGETDFAQLIVDQDFTPGADDHRGPVPIGAVTTLPTEEEKGGRLVVLGDTDWLRGTFLQQPQFVNYSFAFTLTSWLTERDAAVAIPPRRSDLNSMVISQGELGGLAWRIFGLLPLAVALLGFAAWWSRRK